jgi:tRNA dimethylallyltransferase
VKVLILTGPTASGKSALALELAADLSGEIINADSMQVYYHLPVLTACPSEQDKGAIPHHLYQLLGDQDISSAGWWVTQAVQQIKAILGRGHLPIIVGGTGLYLKALTDGISPIPAIPPEYRNQTRLLAQEPDFYQQVKAMDPLIEGRLKELDLQRLTRAYEVKLATGRSIFDWQHLKPQPLPYHFDKMVLLPDKKILHDRIHRRFDKMIEAGVLEEVRALRHRKLRADSPILRAVGFQELAEYVQGKLSLEEAVELAKTATRQYAKRQLTWIRGQAKDYKEYIELR